MYHYYYWIPTIFPKIDEQKLFSSKKELTTKDGVQFYNIIVGSRYNPKIFIFTDKSDNGYYFIYGNKDLSKIELTGTLDVDEYGLLHVSTEEKPNKDLKTLTEFFRSISGAFIDPNISMIYTPKAVCLEKESVDEATLKIYLDYMDHLRTVHDMFFIKFFEAGSGQDQFEKFYKDLVYVSGICHSLVHKYRKNKPEKEEFESFYDNLFKSISAKSNLESNRAIRSLTVKTLKMTALSIGVAFFAGSLFADTMEISLSWKIASVCVAGILTIFLGHRIYSK